MTVAPGRPAPPGPDTTPTTEPELAGATAAVRNIKTDSPVTAKNRVRISRFIISPFVQPPRSSAFVIWRRVTQTNAYHRSEGRAVSCREYPWGAVVAVRSLMEPWFQNSAGRDGQARGKDTGGARGEDGLRCVSAGPLTARAGGFLKHPSESRRRPVRLIAARSFPCCGDRWRVPCHMAQLRGASMIGDPTPTRTLGVSLSAAVVGAWLQHSAVQ